MDKLMLKKTFSAVLSIALCIYISLLLGWEKANWSVMVVVVLAGSETYSHSLLKAKLRVLGTIIGSGVAVLLISLFSQQPLHFFCGFSLFLSGCIYMSTHHKSGHMWSTALIVTTLVTSVGHFDDITSFELVALRIQETLLGVVIYSLVNKVIFASNTERNFYSIADEVKKMACWDDEPFYSKEKAINSGIYKLNELISHPIQGSYLLARERKYWHNMIAALKQYSTLRSMNRIEDEALIQDGKAVLLKAFSDPKRSHESLISWLIKSDLSNDSYGIYPCYDVPLKGRLIYVIQTLLIFTTCILSWRYLDVPGGNLFPMIGVIYSVILVRNPISGARLSIKTLSIFGLLFTLEYVFVLPALDSVYDLIVFYSINILFIMFIAHHWPSLVSIVMGCNFLFLLTKDALRSTPIYDITGPISVYLVSFIVLVVIYTWGRLFSDLDLKYTK